MRTKRHPEGKRLFFLLLFAVSAVPVLGQNNLIKGGVTDTIEKSRLHYAILALIDLSDSTLYKSYRTDGKGDFEIKSIPSGRYTFMVSYPGMADFLRDITITDTSHVEFGMIVMIPQAVLLREVVVRAGLPVRMRGDTLEYTADSFAVRIGTNVEELLKRLPGIQVERNGKIIAQGKEVQTILVDGDEFFSDDPGLVTKYLMAEAIDKVQVYDKKSEEADLTGIDDGKRIKTINLKLKENRKNGYFGRLASATNAGKYYDHEAMAAIFRGSRKVSLFGFSGKTGRPDRRYSSLDNYIEQDHTIIDDGTGGFYDIASGSYDEGRYFNGGLPSFRSGGFHYSDKWRSGAQKLISNYRINQDDINDWTNGIETNVLPGGMSFMTRYENRNKRHTDSQKLGGSFETSLDSLSTLRISVIGRTGKSYSNYSRTAETKNGNGFFVNNSTQTSDSWANNDGFSSDFLLQHKFRKEGRTLSFILQQEHAGENSDNYNFSHNNYYDAASGAFNNTDTLDQLQHQEGAKNSYAARVSYSDKLSDAVRVAVDYSWKTVESTTELGVYKKTNGKYEEYVDTLSNDFRVLAGTHIAGIVFSWKRKKINISVGTKIFFTSFKQVDEEEETTLNRHFINLAPLLTSSVRLGKDWFFNANYSGRTLQPPIEQLQPLRKSSNPLFVQIGNPDLKPGFYHSLNLGLNKYNWLKLRSISGQFNISYFSNSITSSTSIDAQQRVVNQFINVAGIPAFSGSLTYNWQYKKLKLRPMVSLSATQSGMYYIQNQERVKNENRFIIANLGVNYDWTNKVTVSYKVSANYTERKTNVTGNNVIHTIAHVHSIDVTSYLPWKMVFYSDWSLNVQPKNGAFISSLTIMRWNASLYKKFFSKDQLTIKLSVNDILNSNNGYARSIFGMGNSESNRFVVKRYLMMTLAWDFYNSIKKDE